MDKPTNITEEVYNLKNRVEYLLDEVHRLKGEVEQLKHINKERERHIKYGWRSD